MRAIESVLPERILSDPVIAIPEALRAALEKAADGSLLPSTSIHILGSYVLDGSTADLEISERLQWSSARNAASDKVWEVGSKFLSRLVRELRNIICSDADSETLSKKLGEASPSALVPAGLLELGLDKPILLGICAAATYAILKATKGAFCSMTDEQVVDAVKNDRGGETVNA